MPTNRSFPDSQGLSPPGFHSCRNIRSLVIRCRFLNCQCFEGQKWQPPFLAGRNITVMCDFIALKSRPMIAQIAEDRTYNLFDLRQNKNQARPFSVGMRTSQPDEKWSSLCFDEQIHAIKCSFRFYLIAICSRSKRF